MDFKRDSVITLYLAGVSQRAIVTKLEHLKVNKTFVHRTIKRYNDTGSIKKRYGGGRRKTATSQEMVKKVRKRIERNPHHSGRQMAADLEISARSMQRILQNELKLKRFKCQKVLDPNKPQKVQLESCKEQQTNRTGSCGLPEKSKNE